LNLDEKPLIVSVSGELQQKRHNRSTNDDSFSPNATQVLDKGEF
jgi:hypothetical protein